MSLAHRSHIRRLAVARAISVAGGEAAYVCLVTLMLNKTGSPAWVAAVLAAWIGVGGLAAPLAGALGDRFNRKRVMIGSDLAGAACFVALAFADSPFALVGLAALAAICESPFYSASSASVPNLAPESDLTWANATVAAGRTVGSLVGPLLGGALILLAGTQGGFALNALSFAISAALVATVHGNFSQQRNQASATEHGGLMAGFRFVWGNHFLRWMTAAWMIVLVGIGFVLVAELPLAREFGAGSIGYGILIAAWAAGSLAGAAIARRAIGRFGEVRSLVFGAIGMALAIGLVAAAPALVVAALILACGGLLNALSSVAEETLVQRMTPDAVRSRVMAAIEAAVVAMLGIGLVGGGFVVGAVGPKAAYGIAGLIGFAGTAVLAWALLSRSEEPIGQPA